MSDPDTYTPAAIAELTRTLRDLKAEKADVTTRHDDVAKAIRTWMIDRDERVVDVEGLPALRLKPTYGAETWDSEAIFKLINESPIAWRRLVELGCVKLDGAAIAAAVKNGQIAGKPAGGFRPGGTPRLEFDR